MPLLHAAASAAAAIAIVASASGQQVNLKVGDPAPALSIRDWVQGEVGGLESGKVNLVEFWATWCGPCRRAIPHLNRLHTAHADDGLVVIGISDEKTDTVRNFVQRQGPAMSYAVAVDNSDQTKGAWMQAAGRQGIPTTFLVGRDGRILWIGHPMDKELERILPAALAGKYDPILERKAKPLLEAAERSARQRNFRDAYGHLDKVIELDPRVFSSVILRRYELMLTGEKNPPAADAFLLAASERFATDPATLEEFVNAIVSDPDIEPRNLDLAETLADKMVGGARDRGESLAAAARVDFARGRFAQAVERQQEAWMLASPSAKAAYKRVLDNYRDAAERGTASSR